MRKLSEVVKVIDVEPFEAGNGDLCRIRLEISRDIHGSQFHGTVYRLEFYRLQPTFPQQAGDPPAWQDDAMVHVVDSNFDPSLLRGKTVDEVLDNFKRALSDRFRSI